MSSFFAKIRYLLVFLINGYQKTVSFDHSPMGKAMFPHGYCKYHPTCSEYGKQAILKHGMIRGGSMAFWRILRCNPFSKGGHDPVK